MNELITPATKPIVGAAPQLKARALGDALKFLRTNTATGELKDSMVAVNGVQPVKHNYYYDERFFTHDRAAGTLHNVYGQRVVRVTEDFIVGLLGGLEEEVGDAAGEIMYKAGFQWGVEDMKTFAPRCQEEFEVQLNKMGMGMLLETWWWPLQVEGWGSWRYDFRQAKQGLLFIDLFESAVAQSMGNIGKMMCYFYAGLFAAVLSAVARRELACIEIQCYSMGEDYCKFLVSNSKRVNAAAFWRSEGATSADIQKKVREIQQ